MDKLEKKLESDTSVSQTANAREYTATKPDKIPYRGLVLLEERQYAGGTSVKYWM